jgi:rhodanese-related sulfurtransferase
MSAIPREIDVAALADMRQVQAPHAVLDIREPWEVDICAIPGSLFIPMQQIPRQLGELPRSHPLVVLCHHGMRSAMVSDYLRQNGFDNACNLAGGIDAWARVIDIGMPRY